MQTCGLYDEGGEFAYRVGLPGGSGVGSGIVAVMPENWQWPSVAGLNTAGNYSRYDGLNFLPIPPDLFSEIKLLLLSAQHFNKSLIGTGFISRQCLLYR